MYCIKIFSIYLYFICNLHFFDSYIFRELKTGKVGKERKIYSRIVPRRLQNSDLYRKKNVLSETSKLRKTVLQRGSFYHFSCNSYTVK